MGQANLGCIEPRECEPMSTRHPEVRALRCVAPLGEPRRMNRPQSRPSSFEARRRGSHLRMTDLGVVGLGTRRASPASPPGWLWYKLRFPIADEGIDTGRYSSPRRHQRHDIGWFELSSGQYPLQLATPDRW